MSDHQASPKRSHAAFLAQAGWADAEVRPLAADASTRSYYRVTKDGHGAVLMDAPPGAESAACPPEADEAERRALGYNAMARLAGPDSRFFAAIGHALRERGLSAPEIYAADFERGLLLIEDLGDALFARVIEQGRAEQPLYEHAIDVLVHLHAQDTPTHFPLPEHLGDQAIPVLSYDALALEIETELLTDWYLPACGRPLKDTDKQAYRTAWRSVLDRLGAEGRTLVLRDYHAENLLALEERSGPARVGLLDFQDGLVGSRAYDLVSLLKDARRDVDSALEAAMIKRYVARAKTEVAGFDEDAFRDAYVILGVQRNAKIVGIFTRLWRRDGKPRYPSLIPRLWRYLEPDLAHPALGEVGRWFAEMVPEALRGDPMVIGNHSRR